MRPSHVAAALCVLATLVVVPALVMAADLPTAASTMLFSEWFHSQKAGPSSRAKLLGEKEKPETKHICLQETRQYNCRYVGCPNIGISSGTQQDPAECASNTTCVNCRQGSVFQSDLTCCGEDDSYSSYGDEHEGFGSGIKSPILKIGTCDWDVNLHRDSPAAAGTRQSIIENGQKIGDAWATCYLSAGSEYCHNLLCDKMVLTFQGGVYQALVKSTLKEDLLSSSPELSCLTDTSFSPFPPGPNDLRVARNATTPTLYEGEAIIMSGFVTITSLDRSIDFTHGYMDYVAGFYAFDMNRNSNGGASSTAGLAVVTPNTYNIKLVGKKPQAYSFTGKKVSQ